MRIQQYKIGRPGCLEHMIATYHDGKLYALEGIHKMAFIWEEIAVNAPVPLLETDMEAKQQHYEGMIYMERIKLSSVGDKIAVFSAAYRRHTGKPYITHKSDVKDIFGTPVTDELLNAYFKNTEWWGKQPKSIRNYVNNINALYQLPGLKAAPKKTNDFPDEWSEAADKRIPTNKLSEWWKHLRGLGYEPVKNGRGDITKWTRKIVALVFLLWALLLSSCMTPKKMDRWLTKNPDFFKTERDTQQVLTPFPIEISVPLPVDTSTWTWTVSGDLDTNLLFETKRLKGELAIFQDTLLRVNVPPTQPRRRLNLDIQVKPDTIVVRDTLQVPCPTETKTRTVILKYRWKDWLIWILVGALIITIGGRTWLKQK